MTHPQQHFRDMAPDDIAWIADQRASVEQLFPSSPDILAQLRGDASQKLGVVQALLENNAFNSDHTYLLQGMGIILGDVLASEAGLEWRMVEDEYGISPCLVIPGTSIVLFPQTMVSKRVEEGQVPDVFDMVNGLLERIAQLRAQGA